MMSIDSIFEAFHKLKVLIIGDVMIDRYLQGQVRRISPEAPVPVVHWESSEDRLGGAANVALNIAALGATPLLFSVIGRDENQRHFLDLMDRHKLDARGLLLSEERISTVKTRVIAQNQHLLRVDQEDQHDLSERETTALLQNLRWYLDEMSMDVIIFQDYNKGVLTPAVIETVIAEAHRRNIPTVVDPKFNNFWAYRQVTLFKPNLREIRDQLPFAVHPEADSLLAAARALRERLQHGITLITLSEKGLFAEDREGHILIPTHPRTIADVCGAGDTVISTVALGLALGLPLSEIGQMANLAGGQVCEKVGVVPVDREQLQEEYRQLTVD
ncbi:MAG: PfkB family carbohydrate kinase [Saprospiraceae bacterium]|nr:carbohydrate kinase [Lewinella sp.]